MLFKFKAVGKSQWKQLEIEFWIYSAHLSFKGDDFDIPKAEAASYNTSSGQLFMLTQLFSKATSQWEQNMQIWKVPVDTSNMTTRNWMALPCINNADSSRRKPLGESAWRLWIALGDLVTCKELILWYLIEFNIKWIALKLTWTFLPSWVEWHHISTEATGRSRVLLRNQNGISMSKEINLMDTFMIYGEFIGCFQIWRNFWRLPFWIHLFQFSWWRMKNNWRQIFFE